MSSGLERETVTIQQINVKKNLFDKFINKTKKLCHYQSSYYISNYYSNFHKSVCKYKMLWAVKSLNLSVDL